MFSLIRRLVGASRQDAADPRAPTNEANILNQTFRFIAVDVETANRDTSSICQLGLALVTDEGRIHTMSILIDPELAFDRANIRIHGIDADKVRGFQTWPLAIKELRAFLQRHPLVQHSSFDKTAVTGACLRYRMPDLTAQWFDSVTIARRAWPKLGGGHGLANLADHLNIDFAHHDAAEDAKAAALVVLHAETETGQSFAELAVPQSRQKEYPITQRSLEGREGGPLFGQVVCFTGQISLSRTEAATLAAGAGMAVKASMSKKVTLLVVGDQDLELLVGHDRSTKHRRAEELIAEGAPIRIIGETEFRAMVEV